MKVVKEQIISISHNKLSQTFTCFYLFLEEKKKVKDYLMPHTVQPKVHSATKQQFTFYCSDAYNNNSFIPYS